MRVLILSCNTGEGHNSCAKAIKEYYTSLGDECVIQDGLGFISKSVSNFISHGHVFMYRHLPWLFKIGYSYAEKHPTLFQGDAFVRRFLTKDTERLYSYIAEGGFEAVICTHVFTGLMLTAMLEKHPLKLVTCFIATDYTCSPITKESRLDCYFIPDNDLIPDFEGQNSTAEKLIAGGIPIRQMFYSRTEKAKAKELYGIPENNAHLLMMCGSMGCGPIRRLAKSIAERLSADQHLTIVCGTNEKLKTKLLKTYENRPNIHVMGFVENMSALMDSADLYLTKPGGISVTEAAVKGLPMVFVDAVAGCEEYNRIHFIRKGGARTGNTIAELTDICFQLISDQEKLYSMQQRLTEYSKGNAAEIIYNTLKAKAEKLYDK